ncbi:MAG: hypothetical protein RL323_2267 [Pseudomonadota bacterium]|jgi:hypothetical protein
MDSLTQLALGAAVGVAVLGRRTAAWKAALWGRFAGTPPDLDALVDHGNIPKALRWLGCRIAPLTEPPHSSLASP